jgi:hypothetical protein
LTLIGQWATLNQRPSLIGRDHGGVPRWPRGDWVRAGTTPACCARLNSGSPAAATGVLTTAAIRLADWRHAGAAGEVCTWEAETLMLLPHNRWRHLVAAAVVIAFVTWPLAAQSSQSMTAVGPELTDLPGDFDGTVENTRSGEPLEAFYSITGRVSYSVDASGSTAGHHIVYAVKPNSVSTVLRAWMLVTTKPSAPILNVRDVQLAGQYRAWNGIIDSVIGGKVYLSDVTDIVAGQVNPVAPGPRGLVVTEAPLSFQIDGVVLIVIFDDPTIQDAATVALLYGSQPPGGDNFTFTFDDPIDPTSPDARAEMGVGISWSRGGDQTTVIEIQNQRLTSSASGYDDGANAVGAYITAGGYGDSLDNPPDPFALGDAFYDDELYSLLPFLDASMLQLDIYTENASGDDNLFLAHFYLSSSAVISQRLTLAPLTADLAVGATHTLTATLQDFVGGQIHDVPITFEVVGGPNMGANGIVLSDLNGQAQWSYVGNGGEGVDQIVASYENDQSQTVESNTVTADWTITNLPPTADAGGPYTGWFDETIIFDASGSSDPENSIADYEWDLDNDGQYDDATGVTASRSWPAPGSYTIGLRVRDAGGLEDTDTATVTVGNRPPTADAGGPYTAVQGQTIQLDGTGSSDPDPTDALTYAWDLDNNGQYDDSTSATPNFQMPVGAPGTGVNVCLRVTDRFGLFDIECITITVGNRPPVADAGGPYQAAAGQTIQLDASGSSDPDFDDSLTYAWDLDGDGQYDDSTAIQPDYTVPSALPGSTFAVCVRVTDEQGLSDTDCATVTVGNRAPTADPGGPYEGMPNSTITLDGTDSSDPDPGDSLTYAWDLDNDGQFDDSTAAQPQYLVPNATPGTVFTICLRVTDSFGLPDTACTTVTVSNRPPVADAGGPYAGPGGTSVQLDGTGSSDPDPGDALTYAWDLDDDGVFDDAFGSTPNFAIPSVAVGTTFDVCLRVTDGSGLTDDDCTTVTVSNRPPTADPGGPYQGEPQSFVQLDGTGSSDPDVGDTLTYAWDLDGDGQYDDATGPQPNFAIGNVAPGTILNVCLRVTDPWGAMDQACTTVTISNRPPVCDAGGPYDVDCLGTSVTIPLDGSGSFDPDIGDSITYLWTSDCPGAAFDDVTSSTPLLTLPTSCNLICQVTLRVTDEDGTATTCVATVTLTDTGGPTLLTPAADLTVECDGAGNTADLNAWLASQGGAVASDACGAVNWSNDFVAITPGCGATGSALVTFTATDACGHAVQTTAMFAIEDTTGPVFAFAPTDIAFESDGQGNVDDIQAWLQSAVAEDACGPLADLTNNFTELDPNGPTLVTWTATDACGNTTDHSASVSLIWIGEGSTGLRGSLLVWPMVEIKWDGDGKLIQETFITITNDGDAPVRVEFYFVNADRPILADPNIPGDPNEPGHNRRNNQHPLTPNESAFWAASTGQPKGVSPFTILDPGDPPDEPPGRPDPEDPTGQRRILRGFIMGWAVNNQSHEIRWNKLTGMASVVDYTTNSIVDYPAWTFRAEGVPPGEELLDCTDFDAEGVCRSAEVAPGTLAFDGFQYDYAPDRLLLNFLPIKATTFSGPKPFRLEEIDLTMHLMDQDFRALGNGPADTLVQMTVWDSNGVALVGPQQCIRQNESRLLSDLGGTLLYDTLQSDLATVEVNTVEDPSCPGGDARALIGVAMQQASIGPRVRWYGMPIHTDGRQRAVMKWDVPGAPEEEVPPASAAPAPRAVSETAGS